MGASLTCDAATGRCTRSGMIEKVTLAMDDHRAGDVFLISFFCWAHSAIAPKETATERFCYYIIPLVKLFTEYNRIVMG